MHLLDAKAALHGGRRRYWQFSTNSIQRGPLDPEAIYVDADEVTDLPALLSDLVRWFIADGTTVLNEEDCAAVEQTLRALSRMPDEGERAGLWRELADWLAERDSHPVYLRLQRFR
ncbi:MAG: hypothetical protein AAF458_00030 [Pseudomonadota bacterium]